MIRKALPTALLSALLGVPGLAMAQPGEGYWGPHMMWGGWFHMFFGFLMMLLFLAILVGLVVLVVRWLASFRAFAVPARARSGRPQPS